MENGKMFGSMSSNVINNELFPEMMYNSVRHAKIMCTINPDFTVSEIENMILAGMDIARIDFSLHDQSIYKKIIDNVREASKNVSAKSKFLVHVSIAVDTKGPEIQTGALENGHVFLESGAVITLTTDEKFKMKGNAKFLYIDYEDLTNVVDPGVRLYINNCSIMLVVDRVDEPNLICTIVDGGWLGSYKDVKGQGIFRKKLDFTPKDISDLEFAISQKVDCIMNSYTMSAESIVRIKQMLFDYKMTGEILVFAKVENKFGAKRLKEILQVADGIVLSRMDLSVEFARESVFYHHKSLLDVCNQLGKPFVSFDPILPSMTVSPVPEFTDLSDLGHLIMLGVDCLMLSNENCQYLLESIKYTDKMCLEADACLSISNDSVSLFRSSVEGNSAVAYMAVQSSIQCKASAIVTLPVPVIGKVVKLMSKLRPQCSVIAVCSSAKPISDMRFYRSLNPVLFEEPVGNNWEDYLERCLNFALQYGMNLGMIETGDLVVVVSSWKPNTGLLNTIKVEQCNLEDN
ncbi:pyruvate kinase-like [Nilaparvata lugens]|uniref:pyruvate kinase-like n=1 Tax=Nilaparvata lugens TaxID=108931 RepID=UPI00193CBFB0|nr:pyruvate kinase-like [Nilaparvata lugens]XP_039278970.1 pyruvate kinase-like [Nilaparvata lugens]XP_039278971.1 pyruvate kinase-like [Nilaparvata lugens]